MPDCLYCNEPVLPGEEHPGHTPPCHYECVTRAVVGSVAHLQRKCSCFVPGADCGDPEGMTKREAARAAVALYEQLEALGVNTFASGRRIQ